MDRAETVGNDDPVDFDGDFYVIDDAMLLNWGGSDTELPLILHTRPFQCTAPLDLMWDED